MYRHRNRLTDFAALGEKWKRPNAQKHGAFAVDATIPGEDPKEFQKLHSGLIAEWQPSGATEEDAVFSIADLMWRKIRVQKILRANLVMDTCDPHNPMFDQRRGFRFFMAFMREEPEVAFERHASALLTADSIKHLKEKFQRSKYQSIPEWADAVIAEIRSVLLPAAPHSLDAEPAEGDLPQPFRKTVVECRVAISIHLERKLFDRDLDLRERLDAMLERKIKHLIELKATKQMLRRTSALREDEQPRRITATSSSRNK